jgi:hypothetical protein
MFGGSLVARGAAASSGQRLVLANRTCGDLAPALAATPVAMVDSVRED